MLIVKIILGVFAVSAMMGLVGWLIYRSFEKDERNPRRVRRQYIGLGIFVSALVIYRIVDVATGAEPIEDLIGLPIFLCIAWLFFRAARSVKMSPKT